MDEFDYAIVVGTCSHCGKLVTGDTVYHDGCVAYHFQCWEKMAKRDDWISYPRHSIRMKSPNSRRWRDRNGQHIVHPTRGY